MCKQNDKCGTFHKNQKISSFYKVYFSYVFLSCDWSQWSFCQLFSENDICLETHHIKTLVLSTQSKCTNGNFCKIIFFLLWKIIIQPKVLSQTMLQTWQNNPKVHFHFHLEWVFFAKPDGQKLNSQIKGLKYVETKLAWKWFLA